MLASGSDDGTFSIRDLRLLKVLSCATSHSASLSPSLSLSQLSFSLAQEADSVVARFDYHKHPITSIEWSPHEASTLAVTSSDNQLT